MTNTSSTGKALSASYDLNEHHAAALARLTDRYAGDLPAIQQRDLVRVPAAVDAVVHRQARRLFPNLLLIPPAEPPEDQAEDIADALSLLQAAREYLEATEAALLAAARQPGARTGGKPLLTFRRIAAAIGAESEQAAQGRYRRKVGNLNGSDSGADGTP
jgi:hypothetical protein